MGFHKLSGEYVAQAFGMPQVFYAPAVPTPDTATVILGQEEEVVPLLPGVTTDTGRQILGTFAGGFVVGLIVSGWVSRGK